MSINKVIYGDSTLIDLTSDSVTASALMSGVTAHDSSGALVTGTIPVKSSADITVAGPTVTVPSGIYSGSNSVTIPSAVVVPSFTWQANPSISLNNETGVVTAEYDAIEFAQIIPVAGYASQATGEFELYGLSTYQLPVKSSGDITISGPTVAVPSGYYTANNSITIPQASINSSFVWRIDPSIGFNSTTGVVTADFDQEFVTFLVTQSGYTDEMTIYLNPYGVSSYQIPVSSSGDITVAGPTVSVSSGYYAENNSVTIPSAIAKDTSLYGQNVGNISIDSTGLLNYTLSMSGNRSVIQSSGYINANTSVNITASAYKTYQLPTQAAATITPTESAQTAVASGKYTIGAVTVAAISSDYVGSNIATRSATDLTVNGSTITAPAGYYGSSASANVTSGSVQVNSLTITQKPSISLDSSTGVVSASINGSTGIGATVTSGYVQSASFGTVTVNGSSSFALPTKAAATIIPSIADTTIDSGIFLIGSQTIKGDSHLVGENIAAGTSIFGINGSYTGSAAVITETIESGKTIVDIDTGDIYHWAGLDMEFVQDLGSVSWTLDDTTYSDWTPSTSSSKSIKSAVNVTTFSANMANYEYLVLWNVVINCAYDDGYTDTARFVKQYETLISYLHRRPTTFANLDSGIFNGNVAINYAAYLSDYYNGSSTHTFAYQASYGFWMGATAPTFSSSTSNTPTITVKSPSVSTRCSTSYFSTDNAEKINTTNTTLKAYAKLYRCPVARSFSYNLYKDLVDYRNLTERL